MSEQGEQGAMEPERSEPQHSGLWSWWKALGSDDRAGRAELRRCGTPAEVAFTAPYQRLLRRLGSRLGAVDARRVAAFAAILAHVDEEPPDRASLPARMGRPRGEGLGPAVSDARFRAILRSDDPEELMRDLIRAVRQLDRRAAVESLFHDLMRWDEQTRIRWARDYYEAGAFQKS